MLCGLARDKDPGLLQAFLSYGHKKLYNIPTQADPHNHVLAVGGKIIKYFLTSSGKNKYSIGHKR